MLRLGRIILDVPPPPYDEIVDRASVGVLVQPPNILKNRLARHCLFLVPDQIAKKFSFHQRKLDRIPVHSQFQFAEINDSPIEGEHIVLAASLTFSPRLGHNRSNWRS